MVTILDWYLKIKTVAGATLLSSYVVDITVVLQLDLAGHCSIISK